MPKTFNRSVLSVNEPDIEYSFVNHNDWKGVNSNKNFLSIDQNTFENAINVYVDGDNVLRSRPSIKVHEDFNFGTSIIHKIWSFADVIVVLTSATDTSAYKLCFQHSTAKSIVIVDTDALSAEDIRLVLADNKILVFTSSSLKYFDLQYAYTEDAWKDGQHLIYIPVKYRTIDGIDDDIVEYDNELTTSYIHSHIFSNLDKALFSEFIGDEVTIKIGSNAYDITFFEENDAVFVGKSSSLTVNNFSNEYVYGDGGKSIPLVSVSENDTMLIVSDTSTLKNGIVTTVIDMYFTVDGYSFTKLPQLDNIVGIPKLSKNGIFVFAFTNDALNVINVLKDDSGNATYTKWTNILEDKSWKYYKQINFNNENCIQHWGNLDYQKNIFINGDFINEDNFAFICPTVTAYSFEPSANYDYSFRNNTYEQFPLYNNIMSVVCKNGVFYEYLSNGIASCEYDNTIDAAVNTNITMTTSLYTKFYDYDKVAVGKAFFYVDYNAPSSNTNNGAFKITTRALCHNLPIDPETPFEIEFDKSVNTTQTVYKNDAYWFMQVQYTYNKNGTLTLSIQLIINNFYQYGHLGVNYGFGYFTPQIQMYLEDNICNVAILSALHSRYAKLGEALQFQRLDPLVIQILSLDENNNQYATQMYDCATFGAPLKVGLKISSTSVHIAYYNNPTSSIVYHREFPFYYEERVEGDNTILYTALDFDVFAGEILYYEVTSYDGTDARVIISKSNDHILFNNSLITGKHVIPLLFDATPIDIFNSDTVNRVYVASTDNIYKSTSVTKVEILQTVLGENKYIVPDLVLENGNLFFTSGQKLMISQTAPESEYKLYFSSINTELLNENITALHTLSSTETLLMTSTGAYICAWTENGYTYTRSKIPVGCRKYSDIITLSDGTTTVFSSTNGLVAMTYQDFVASTEQSLTYLSDVIFSQYAEFNVDPIQLYLYNHWLIIYNKNKTNGFILDTRNASLWPVLLTDTCKDIITYNYRPLLLLKSNGLYKLDTSDNKYYDEHVDASNTKIEWSITSQKLHLNAPNHYKRILNLIFSSVDDAINSYTATLSIKNYRKVVHASEEEIIEYDVDIVRTFVKRVNYAKVSEFQYTLSADLDNAIQVPLSLTNIGIKYLITGVIR